MFDISFTELMVVGAVALIVIGPEKLPKVARTVGHLVGRLQRYVSDVKSDINREMEFDELRRLRKEMNDAATAVESSAREHAGEIRGQLDSMAKAANITADEAAASPAAQADAGLSAPAESVSLPRSDAAAASPPAAPADSAQAGAATAGSAHPPTNNSPNP